MRLSILLIIVLACFNSYLCARILCICPTPSKSHQVVFKYYVKELVKRGHTVVFLTTDPVNYKGKEYENLTQIDMRNTSYEVWNKKFDFANDPNALRPHFGIVLDYFEYMTEIIGRQLELPEVKKLINNKNEKFDLLVVESICTPMHAFAERFNIPIIAISTVMGTTHNFREMGSPTHSVLYPESFSPYVGNLSFFKRLHQTLEELLFRYFFYWTYLPMFEAVAKKHFGENSTPVGEIAKKTDLMFLYSHVVFIGARPIVPNIVYIGGLHIQPPKPLPAHLQKFLDSSSKGVVYFSLGSNFKYRTFSLTKWNMCLQAFSELPFDVLWKVDNGTEANLPYNVYAQAWLPQQDILAHPNVKAFVTQGGLQSAYEALYRGVPVVGMPIVADQYQNVEMIRLQGVGVKLDYVTLTKDSLKGAIVEVMMNPKYKQRSAQVARLMVDEPMSPMDRALWWTSYMIRHKSAAHLRAPMADAPLYQYFFLDVIAFCGLGLMLSIASVLWASRAAKRRLVARSLRDKKKSE